MMFFKLWILFPVIILLHTNVRVRSDGISESISNAVRDCRIKERMFAAAEDNYVKKTPKKPSEPSGLAGSSFVETDTQIYQFERDQRKFECVADELQIYDDVPELYSNRRYHSLVNQCKANQPTVPKCNPFDMYRSINGTCNNLFNPNWGSIYDCFQRLFPANYEVDGTETIECCENSPKEDLHPECIPIDIHPDDPFYSKYGVKCFNMVRAVPCITCSLEKRVPITAVTAFLDCSFVYGSTHKKSQELRRNDGSGKLKSREQNSCEILPADTSEGSSCGNAAKEEFCFNAGDSRVNQQTALMSFHTLFLREHNRLAGILKDMNPHWDEEKLYQESRKILIAEWQIIIYDEYLPILIGSKLMQRRRLNSNTPGEYDPSINPMISVEFSSAAMRVHSILPGVAAHNDNDEYLRHLYQNASAFYNDRMSEFLFNMANTEAEKYDWFFPKDVTNYLYKSLSGTWGFDLVAVDIQRGRDVGLPTYAQLIEYLWHPEKTINSFDDLEHYISPECLESFRNLYTDVRDVDFFVGIICEKIPDDMIISPTAARIIAHQFHILKYGDRHFWEFENAWTDNQRESIKTASLAKLICDNTEVNFIQPKAFQLPSQSNIPQACSTIPGVDLSIR